MEPLLGLCAANGRALLTNNVADLAVIVRQWQAQGRSHHGLIFTSDHMRWALGGLDLSVYAHPCLVIPGPTIKLLRSDSRSQGGRGDRSRAGGKRRPSVRDKSRKRRAEPVVGPPVSTWPPLAARARRKVDPIGNVSFAGAVYNVGRAWSGEVVDVFTAEGALCVAKDDTLVRRHDVRHDIRKEAAAFRDRRGELARSTTSGAHR